MVPISALRYASGEELPKMPHAREALVYPDDYWAAWLERNHPEFFETAQTPAAE